MNKAESIVDVCLLTAGSAYSLANIEHILGITILVIQLGWLLTKLGVKIYNHIKKGKDLEALNDDVGSVVVTIEDFIESIKTEEEVAEDEHND